MHSSHTMSALLLAVVVSCSLFELAHSAPRLGISRNVKSDLVMIERPRSNRPRDSSQFRNSRKIDVPSGEGLDLFYRFGFFSLSVRVVPRGDAGSWLIREPTADLFEQVSVSERYGQNSLDQQFQMFFCDDIAELNEAYFRDFTAERIEQPNKLFTGSWHASTKSKYFGLGKDAFDGQSSFVLVKLPKKQVTISVDGQNMKLVPAAQRSIDNIQIGNPESVLDFMHDYGSHYIKDVVVGDLIYQVIALTQDQYRVAKSAVRPHMNAGDFQRFYDEYLAPWKVREVGKIEAASGDQEVMAFTEQNLQTAGMFGTYPNIFKLQQDPQLADRLEDLTDNTQAVLGLNFASLRNWVGDLHAREYYDEIVDTQTALWESNL